MTSQERPSWWDWNLELSPHVLKRMVDRGFSEVDLREMIEHAGVLRLDVVVGRWVVAARWRRKNWEVVVEPDPTTRMLVVVTAYPVTRGTR